MSETDKSRDLIFRELSNTKDVENERIRQLEGKSQAELRLQERLAQGLKAENKELSCRIEDLLTRHEILVSQKAEEHHNTVKYFEGVVAQLKGQVARFHIP